MEVDQKQGDQEVGVLKSIGERTVWESFQAGAEYENSWAVEWVLN